MLGLTVSSLDNEPFTGHAAHDRAQEVSVGRERPVSHNEPGPNVLDGESGSDAGLGENRMADAGYPVLGGVVYDLLVAHVFQLVGELHFPSDSASAASISSTSSGHEPLT
jgi:hypothetical protein